VAGKPLRRRGLKQATLPRGESCFSLLTSLLLCFSSYYLSSTAIITVTPPYVLVQIKCKSTNKCGKWEMSCRRSRRGPRRVGPHKRGQGQEANHRPVVDLESNRWKGPGLVEARRGKLEASLSQFPCRLQRVVLYCTVWYKVLY
jgi:hypothetical protein